MSHTGASGLERRRRLLEIPASPQALLDLGMAAFRENAREARSWFARAAAAAPDEAATHFSLAVTTPDSKMAARSLARALAVEPGYVPAWLERAAREPAQGTGSLLRAFAVDGDAEIAASLAGALLDEGKTRRARAILNQGLRQTTQNARIWVNCGRASVEEGDWDAGLTAMRRAISLAPSMFEAWMNIGSISEDWGDRGLGVVAACRAVVVNPSDLKARWNRTLVLLGQGDWRRGFADHDVRLQIQQAYPHVLPGRRWDGKAMPGRLFIHDEIGYGDVFNFIRYLPLARARVGSLTLEVKPGLAQLLEGFPGIDQLAERGAAPPSIDYEAYLPLESLPAVFGTTVDKIPAVDPVLRPPSSAQQYWSERLRHLRSPRIGVCWSGNRASGFDHKRSCALADIAPILGLAGCSFVSLQKEAMEADPRLFETGSELRTFADTAGIIANLDLVITVETSVAHLAGAMGRPVWILLAPNPAWRWLTDRTDSPWYPSARLFRRGREESWRELAERAASELRAGTA